MKFKREFVKAVELFLLLSLMFWSFTWNSEDLESHLREARGKTEENDDINCEKNGVILNKHFVKYILSVSDESRKPTESIFIPSFNEWKQKEMTKYEKGPSTQEEANFHRKSVRRKLNYASSKCGAKVLTSNPEAKHRTAVLSEKSDEYLLNPCRVRTWFIVELCDTVEATQIDLANYELYSSSPREFSVFWSEVYPTSVWHLLGSFEAKDQRTVQAFPVHAKNLGKFIKVIIYNHHGKEHYCPLSMLRVLGYSMVQKFEDIETPESNPEYGRYTPSKPTISSIKPTNRTIRRISDTLAMKKCKLFLRYCANKPKKRKEKLCANPPICRFLIEILIPSSVNCLEFFCFPDTSERIFKPFNNTIEGKQIHLNESKRTDLDTIKSESDSVKPTYSDILSSYGHKQFEIEEGKEDGLNISGTKKLDSNLPQNFANEMNVGVGGVSRMKEKCTCENKLKEDLNSAKMAEDDGMKVFLEEGESIESAKLIHKDSVLFKLTARIKASETDLNFINKYLQQLSQSYRQQMEDMKVVFDSTLKIVTVAAEKAKIVDNKQEESISALEKKTTTLSRKIDFLMKEQRDLIKKVIELHGFFLILELIIISTIFTVFLNIISAKK